MSTAIHVETIILSPETDHLRIPLDWDVLASVGPWTTISFLRNKPTWIEAKTIDHLFNHPDLASSLILLKSPSWDTTLAIYPVSTLSANNDLVVDTHGDQPVIHTNARRIIPCKQCQVYVVCVEAKGRAAERRIVKTAVDRARELVGGRAKKISRSDLWDGLGVCTWESFGGSSRIPDRPTKEMLLSLVPDLEIRNFLIDDGWQDIRKHSSRLQGQLYSFDCWDGMGASMPDVVSALKIKGIEEVGVWLTLQGYWWSIDPDSPLAQRYNCMPHRTARSGQPRGGVVIPLEPAKPEEDQWLPSPEMAGQFWEDWFTEMKSWGVGFVKVDNQAHGDAVTSPTALLTQQAMWSGMLAAVIKVWGSLDRVIICMSHNERMLNGPGGLDFDRPPGNLVFRNSDDFNLPYENRHPDYIQMNIYQSILTSHLSLIPDFDMFASNPRDHWPTYHALLRCLSPGPLLLSDTPDTETDKALLAKMTAKTRSGRLKAVKTDSPAQALPGRWFWDNLQGEQDGPATLAYVKVPSAQGTIIGAWNCRRTGTSSVARDRIFLQDLEDALEVDRLDGEYALWSVGHSGRNGRRVELFRPGSPAEMPLELEKAECEAIIIAKVWEVKGQKVAVVGMLDKFAPLARLQVSVQGGEQSLSRSAASSDSAPDELKIRTEFASDQLSVLVFGDSKPSASFMVDGNAVASAPWIESVRGAWLLSVTVGVEGQMTSGEGAWEVQLVLG